MNCSDIETHPLPPFTPSNAKLLMLGSFPPPRARWKMDFYYPNFQNDMWRIFGVVFFGNKDYFVEAGGKAFKEEVLRAFLADKGIAISDTAQKVIRLQGNASDKFLQIVEPVDLQGLLAQMPLCQAVMTTGELATDTLLSLMPSETGKPKIGGFAEAEYCGRVLRLYRLPSSSRAYPLALEKKAEVYGRFFEEIGLL
ncbi:MULTISPECIES: uracil-DNA glycosylase family protein [unclassified Neisseria]|uniref:uracil-DNA glycosylase family protein n=1 Tax=unclassified Neisseria TaxID=2623750 RepID=UPI002665B275|nr:MULTISPECIES: uracil-DNA glycosylase family protein [unclassified Neisseria]MDO1510402.1 uracil-DNA glycosylase family protein [Neisseria sp. MVDL19-042950]MDO1516571.1 uracil-DNA glycosylase family protein [Neisseria sp. MVDL18-041461]MDO1563636.1 uracil-DNA glycosylase family protein [Neisseria sp. MVDL20-010259]